MYVFVIKKIILKENINECYLLSLYLEIEITYLYIVFYNREILLYIHTLKQIHLYIFIFSKKNIETEIKVD